MFPKGTVIYPDVVCSVNNTYLPEEKGDVNISAYRHIVFTRSLEVERRGILEGERAGGRLKIWI